MNNVILTMVLVFSSFNAQSQATDNLPQPDGHTPREEVRQGDRRPEESESLTSEQKNRVKVILSKYNESSLTATDAKAINNAFREAGIPNGAGLQQAIKNADFVLEKISELDPPPDRSGDERMPSNKSEPRQPARGKERLDKYQMVCSMSRKGNCWDNAPCKALLPQPQVRKAQLLPF